MSSSFIALCKGRGCYTVRTFSVRVVLGTTVRGDTEVRGRCPVCGTYVKGLIEKATEEPSG